MKVLPISILNKKVSGGGVPPFFPPSEGDLIILNGQTVTLTAPTNKAYTSIDIQSGGTLNITGNGNIAEIYCSGTFNVDGTILCRATERNGYSYAGTTSSGFNYGYTATQRNGGTGGKGSQIPGGLGGAGTNGYGGGGGGGSEGVMAGGAGGSNNGSGAAGAWRHGSYGSNVTGTGNPYAGTGGAGNVTNSNGGTGGSGNSGTALQDGGSGGGSGGGGGSHNYIPGNPSDKITINITFQGGGGGGGGHKGLHGGILFLYSVLPMTGSGSVIASGSNGFNGGAGNEGNAANSAGGGGGGGAGGTGGNIIIQAPSYSFSTSVSGGSGGGGGGVLGAYGGAGGAAGLSGNNGTVQVVL
jgi:hypothetical protein